MKAFINELPDRRASRQTVGLLYQFFDTHPPAWHLAQSISSLPDR
jgi:hypothetical protein